LKEKQNTVLTWNAEDLKFHQGYLTAVVEILEDNPFFSEES